MHSASNLQLISYQYVFMFVRLIYCYSLWIRPGFVAWTLSRDDTGLRYNTIIINIIINIIPFYLTTHLSPSHFLHYHYASPFIIPSLLLTFFTFLNNMSHLFSTTIFNFY